MKTDMITEQIQADEAFTQVEGMLDEQQPEKAAAFLRELHPSDSAELLSNLDADQQAVLIEHLDVVDLADVLEQMDEDDMIVVSQHMDIHSLAEVLDEVEADVAADFLGELDSEVSESLLTQMETSEAVEPLLAYDPECAGGIMNQPPPVLRRQMGVADAFAFLREHFRDEHELLYLYVVDRFGALSGVVSMRSLILADPTQTIDDIMSRRVFAVDVEMDQETVAQMIAHYDLLAIPVIDANRHLVGVISMDDVVDVIEQEATEDIYRLAQVSENSGVFSSLPLGIRNRLPWLVINLGTALLASAVVALFESTIAQLALLAAFLPIVAGEGGNAGNQTMTIMVRSFALGEVKLSQAWAAVGHEALLGLLHGIILGIMIGAIAWFWSGKVILGIIIGVAMLANLIIASIAGVLVPTALKWIGVDPALASSVFVTTTTDVMGFAIFLSLASYFLPWLI